MKSNIAQVLEDSGLSIRFVIHTWSPPVISLSCSDNSISFRCRFFSLCANFIKLVPKLIEMDPMTLIITPTLHVGTPIYLLRYAGPGSAGAAVL